MRFEWCDSGWRCCLITWWQENAYGIGMRTLMTKAYPILPPGGLICNLCNRHYNVVLYLVKVWPRVHFISALNSRVRRVFGIVFFLAQPSLYHIFCLFSWVQHLFFLPAILAQSCFTPFSIFLSPPSCFFCFLFQLDDPFIWPPITFTFSALLFNSSLAAFSSWKFQRLLSSNVFRRLLSGTGLTRQDQGGEIEN